MIFIIWYSHRITFYPFCQQRTYKQHLAFFKQFNQWWRSLKIYYIISKIQFQLHYIRPSHIRDSCVLPEYSFFVKATPHKDHLTVLRGVALVRRRSFTGLSINRHLRRQPHNGRHKARQLCGFLSSDDFSAAWNIIFSTSCIWHIGRFLRQYRTKIACGMRRQIFRQIV